MSSIFFAVLLALFMRSLQYGSYDYMVNTSVSLYTGYLQVQGKGYWDDRSFDESFDPSQALMERLKKNPSIETSNPRIESVVLISHDIETRISPITGIDPESENAMTGLKKRIVRGSYLTDTSSGIIISEGIADRMKVTIGDTIAVFGQGYQGVTAADLFPIEGILHFPIPKINNAMAFISLKKAQQLFNAYDRVTSIALMIDDANDLSSIRSDLTDQLESGLVVMTWEEMTPELVQSIEADNAGGILMLIILYVVIGFGIFGTIMMMTIERTREFGLLIALGMKRSKLIFVSTIETILVSMMGAIAGMIGAFPIILYYHFNPIQLSGDLAKAMLAWGLEPIMPVMLDVSIFTAQTAAVFVIALITSIYPLFFLRKIKPVSAMQGRGGVK